MLSYAGPLAFFSSQAYRAQNFLMKAPHSGIAVCGTSWEVCMHTKNTPWCVLHIGCCFFTLIDERNSVCVPQIISGLKELLNSKNVFCLSRFLRILEQIKILWQTIFFILLCLFYFPRERCKSSRQYAC